MKPRPFVLILAPDFRSQTGGVQTYSATLVRALARNRHRPRILCLQWDAFRAGRWWRLPVYVIRVLAVALFRRPALVIATHLHLARVFPWLAPWIRHRWLALHGVECWEESPGSRRVMASATRLLSVSRHTAGRVREWNPGAADRLALFPNHLRDVPPVPPEKAEARRRLGWPEAGMVWLAVSRLARSERPKGIDQVMRALAEVSELADVRYVIVGAGEDRAYYEDLSIELGLGERVHLAGRVPGDQLSGYYAACDALVLPSRKEGFGLVFLEALAQGRPVLAGNADGSPDPLLDGDLGILVDPLRLESIRSGLGELRERLRAGDGALQPERLRRKVLEAFGPEKMQERLNNLLRECGIV